MWLELLRRVVLIQRISNAGKFFIQALNKLSSPGGYVFPSTMLPKGSNRLKYRVQNRPPSGDTQPLRSNIITSCTVCLFPLPLWRPCRLTAFRESI